MKLFPAIDLYDGKAVRLYKGDYGNMTVYSENPIEIARDFERKGIQYIHLVDLEGAKDGTVPNIDIIKQIAGETRLFCQVGGGIRTIETIDAYLQAGIDRVILGTAAVRSPSLLKEAVEKYGDRIAVGVDIKDGFVAIHGWTEKTDHSCFAFCEKMQDLGVKTVICTDISKDGAMKGTNRGLYKALSERLSINITASGGISDINDIKALRELGIYGAIIGKAYYIGAIDLEEALEAAR